MRSFLSAPLLSELAAVEVIISLLHLAGSVGVQLMTNSMVMNLFDIKIWSSKCYFSGACFFRTAYGILLCMQETGCLEELVDLHALTGSLASIPIIA